MRKIIHIDMDAFYASVELRDRPELRQLPVIVAHDRPRSVVTTASYIARQYGCRSAMPVARARQLCPQVICIAPDFAKYRAVSAQVQQIFARYTDQIEPLSLDEAYLDVTRLPEGFDSATAVAMQIRADIFRETGLTASAGVAPNKFLAKIASDWHKPDGLYVIKPGQVQQFIAPLELTQLPGVGQVTAGKLQALGWRTVADLQQVSEQELIHHFGQFGQRLYGYARGIDERPVQGQRTRQQVSRETTLQDNQLLAGLQGYWTSLTDEVWQLLQRKQLQARGVQVKLKTTGFRIVQHSKSYPAVFGSLQQLQQAVHQLVSELAQQQAANTRYRLVGVGVFQLQDWQAPAQLGFFVDDIVE